jgi:hypothetical protein
LPSIEGRISGQSSPRRHPETFPASSGPHTGINEAFPAGKYAGQFFEPLGFTVVDEWYIVGEFHGSVERSTQGRLGDIRGCPSTEDLRKVEQDTVYLLQRLRR